MDYQRGTKFLLVLVTDEGIIAKRCAAMLRRVYRSDPVMFAGGVAYNPCMRVLLEEEFKQQIFVLPQSPNCWDIRCCFAAR